MQIDSHIIGRLTESQRIRLLTNFSSLSDPELSALGVPTVTVSSLASLGDGRYPSPSALARSWNTALVSAVATDVCRHAMGKGIVDDTCCLSVPGARASGGVKGDSLSEDPLLAGEMAGAVLRGVSNAGLNACMEGYSARRSESRPDRVTDARVLYEQLVTPFTTALSAGPCLGVLMDADTELPAEWRERGIRPLRRRVSDRDTVKALTRGDILLEGSAIALQSAMHTYRRLTRAIEHGKATTGELNAAIAAGEAISEETVNEALERLLSFVHAYADKQKALETADDEALTERALSGATVLLANRDSTLPLRAGTRFCVVGAPAHIADAHTVFDALGKAGGCTCLGYAQGYESDTPRSEQLLEAAVELAREADVILLLLSARGYGPAADTALPANRLALVDRLSRLHKRLVVVLDADGAPDLRVLRYAATPPAAVLLAPLQLSDGDGGVGVTHALETLLGLRHPGGRLTATAIDPDDPSADRGTLKTGPFLGYRYYDTVGAGTLYPFGHGLTYTSLRYSSLALQGGEITFTVTNTGTRPGVAVPQVYLGATASAVLRPRKELIGFARLELAPGESGTVRLPLQAAPVYTPSGPMVESGAYTVYVGESVTDIRLSQSTRIRGETVEPDGASPADYLPSVSNILKDHYTLEAEYTPMKASLRNPLFGIAALVLAACVKVLGMVLDVKDLYVNIVAAVLAVGAVVFLVMELADRKRHIKREQKQLEEINRILFSDARTIAAPTAEELFAETHEAPVEEEAVEAVPVADNGAYDHFADVDRTLTFAAAAQELRRLAAERGVDIDEATARGIFAALATTRLIVVKGMSNSRFQSLHAVLCEYLGCPVCLDAVDASYTSESAVLFRSSTADMTQVERGVLTAILSAQERMRHLHVAALTDVRWADISTYFVPFAAYARAPFSACNLSVQDSDGRTLSYHLPENLWFLLNLKEGETLARIPDYIADVATVHTWSVGSGRAANATSEFRPFYYGQMLYLSDRTKSSFVMDEDIWKRIDRLESFAAKKSEFRIGNKLCLGMETYLAVLADSGVELPAALDEALSVKLLPAIIRALSGKLSRDEQGLGEALDAIFGDDSTARARKTVKESGAELM